MVAPRTFDFFFGELASGWTVKYSRSELPGNVEIRGFWGHTWFFSKRTMTRTRLGEMFRELLAVSSRDFWSE